MAAPPAVGWALASTSCPAGTTSCSTGLFCCPSNLTCTNSGDAIAEACCEYENDCVGPLELAPVCADPSWSLWTLTTASPDFNYFCCLGGQIGLKNAQCGPLSSPGRAPTSIAIPVTPSSTPTGTPVINTSFSSFTPPTSISTYTPPTSFSIYTPATSFSIYTPPTSISSFTPPTSTSSFTPGSASSSSRSSTGPAQSSASTSGGVSVRDMVRVGLVVQVALLAVVLSHC
ncbi:hypothetical protein NA56DRAFT_749874 [Hyaloscypha hepaticicola]|uniref:Uncharacterized protein n=1 Tax=Hyaloscypha hepaticicola TaxID=2082293 RepID=A0A2J6Q2C1_9HELO|nr:hypothetical protein NA56DRAFT_749874 [Hyaloscypha hepaticicola]